MKVSVVILNWNAEHLLRKFLPTLIDCSTLPEGWGDVEVVVADNGSTDDSQYYVRAMAALHPHFQLRFLPLDKNWGFAEGYNRALAQIDATYVVLLNDDVEVSPSWLVPMVKYMDAHPDTAACQPMLLKYGNGGYFEYAGACGGYLDRYGYPFCRGRIFNTVEPNKKQYTTTSDLLWATGACLFIRLDDYRRAGGLDGRFFAHMEEVDLCWRLSCRNRKIACVTDSIVYHMGGASLAAGNPYKTFLNFRNNLLMLYKNLPTDELQHVMRVRRMLDIVAAFAFLLKGERKNFSAVFRARRAYRNMKDEFRTTRDENLSAARQAGNPSMSVPGRRPIFLLWRYHFKRQHTFTQLS